MPGAKLETQKRYPYLNTKFVELDGDFYIIQNDISLIVKRAKNQRSLLNAQRERNHLRIAYHASEAILFLTPNDEIIKRTKGEVV